MTSPWCTMSPSATTMWAPMGRRYRPAGQGPPPIVLDGNPRAGFGVLGLGDDLGGESGHFVQLLLHGDPFDDVPEFHPPRNLGQDGNGVGIPFRDQLAALHGLPVFHLDLGPVDDGVAFPLAAVFIGNGQFAVPVHDHQIAALAPNRAQVEEFDAPVVPRLEGGLLGAAAGGAADVEGPHGQLGPRLADGLGGNDAHGLADVHHMPPGQVAPVAAHADPPFRPAGQNRTDLDLFQTRRFRSFPPGARRSPRWLSRSLRR